ncbi:hypothetical protein I302_101065 [Kwoniella bestiolae CBS 10118]|uniref:Uncharacterized protein n=1 Tax=Kwoniella bestiolae CBS 10118 TaxID=1296100 RepID=A0A1B9G6X5_9TREE|nr:hypothetical protein I302_04441 [Kwoniella bestiolae CBS 10118]OCF26753.1 hypothetical protein I302_04441 [Kwoniella bestiolae CBS 10118]
MATPIPNESSSKWYLHQLDTHIHSSKLQIQGQRSVLVPNKRNPFPTIVPPSDALWTPDEKSVFFASLRRHSKYRVDLIASEVRSKTEEEVDWYLDLLDLGSEVIGQVDRRRHDEGLDKLRWDGLRSWRKGLSPAARVVSDRWVDVEEALAEWTVRDVEGREREEREAIIRKERRAKKKSMVDGITPLEEWKKDMELTPYLRNKLIEGHPSYKNMTNQWEVDDYLREMDGEKLGVVNNLLKSDWSTWYADRVNVVLPLNKSGDTGNTVEDEGQEEEEVLEGGIPTKGDPQGKITIDQRNYNEIMNIPKKERTPDQRKLLSKIINRRRNREKYRIQKLMEEGLSRDEIDLAGGADAIFQSRELNEEGQPTLGAGVQQPKKVVPRKMDSNVLVGHLRKIGMYDYLMMGGMEVFNYEMIERVNRRLNLNDPRGISFNVLQGIHSLLVNQLRQLIYNTIIIAEQAYFQQPPDDDNVTFEISREHVHQALLRVGLVHPQEIILDFIDRLFDNEDDQDELDDPEGEKEKEDIAEEEEVGVRIPRYRSAVLPPGEVQWKDIPYMSTSPSQAGDEEEEKDEEYKGSSDGETEAEDLELDELLDKMDEAHDKLYEKALWGAVDGKAGEEGDRSEIWTMDRKNELKSEREYINLLLSTDSLRRKRRYQESIYQRYPTTRIKKLARANKRMKSNAWIVDSDSDTSAEEGFVWDPNEGEEAEDEISETEDELDEQEEEGEQSDEGEKQDEVDELDKDGEGRAETGENGQGEEEDELEFEDEKGEEQDEDEEEDDEYEDEKGDE